MELTRLTKSHIIEIDQLYRHLTYDRGKEAKQLMQNVFTASPRLLLYFRTGRFIRLLKQNVSFQAFLDVHTFHAFTFLGQLFATATDLNLFFSTLKIIAKVHESAQIPRDAIFEFLAQLRDYLLRNALKADHKYIEESLRILFPLITYAFVPD